MRTGISILAALATLSVAGADLSAAPLGVSALEKKVDDAVAELKVARAELHATKDAQSALAHRIAALKRRNQKSPELARLLRESTDADAALREKIRTVNARQKRVLSVVRGAFNRIDKRMAALTPRLRQKDPAAVRELRDLRDARDRMRGVLLSVKQEERRREWASYVVKINPLDGPEDLREKEEVVDLAKSKLAKKRVLLAQLIKSKRIADAASTFSTDTSLTDEAVRPGRITGGTGGGNNLTAFAGGASEETNARSADVGNNGPAAPAAPPQDAAQEADDNFTQAGGMAPPPAPGAQDPASRGETLNDGAVPQLGATAGAAKSTVDAAPARTPVGPGPVASQLDPNQLLNLSLDGLSPENVDLATLQALIAEIEGLEAALDAQARTIRSRADQLERDESK